MNDLEILVAMLARAGIGFEVDSGEGWNRRIKLDGDRCLVFGKDQKLAGIRSHNDLQSFDGD